MRRRRSLQADPYRIAVLEYELGFTDEKPEPPFMVSPGAVIPYRGDPPVYVYQEQLRTEGAVAGVTGRVEVFGRPSERA